MEIQTNLLAVKSKPAVKKRTAASLILIAVPSPDGQRRSFSILWGRQVRRLTAELTITRTQNTHLQSQIALLQTQLNEDDKAKKRRLHNQLNALALANADLYKTNQYLQSQLTSATT